MAYIRRASHAYSWYEGNEAILRGQIDEWISQGREGGSNSPTDSVRTIVVPHAGYAYSGTTAGYGYQAITPLSSEITRIFILGPSHHVALDCCLVSNASQLETPLGHLEVDARVRAALVERGGPLFQLADQSTDEDEHSLELHLPFVKYAIDSSPTHVSVVPIMVGSLSGADYEAAANALRDYYFDPHNLFVVSSDFCHWGRRFRYSPFDANICSEIHQFIEWMDRRGVDLIVKKDLPGFQAYLRETKNTICGRNPITLVLYLLSSSDGEGVHGRLTHYAQSSSVRSLQESSVSYASIVFSQH